MTFSDWLKPLGISQLSELQENAVQTILHNPNVVLLAPTGTGKTLAFLLPLLQKLHAEKEELQALILSPTRELAIQTYSVLQQMKTPFKTDCVHGGRAAMEEHRHLRSLQPHILVGTPGRVLDHIEKNNFSTQNIQYLIIDEFDKMLELKFQDELDSIVAHLTQVKENVLVSATNSDEIHHFSAFRNQTPIYLNYLGEEESAVPSSIQHYYVLSPQKDKLETLRQLLCTFQGEPAVVFVNYREAVERVGQYLKEQGFYCSLFHGGLEQEVREKNLFLFASGTMNILVSTDLSARGLDIRALRHVVHYHLPMHQEEYMHRCGRTGRWDDQGASYALLGPEENIPEYNHITFKEYLLMPPFGVPRQPEWMTVYIGKGKKDKISKGDVMGFLCKQGGASREDVGVIEIKDHYTYVSIKRTKYKTILHQCVGEKIKKMSTKVEVYRG